MLLVLSLRARQATSLGVLFEISIVCLVFVCFVCLVFAGCVLGMLFVGVFGVCLACFVCLGGAGSWGACVPWGCGVAWVIGFFGEFDPGSGRTLAACLTHASRTGLPFFGWVSGERVSIT